MMPWIKLARIVLALVGIANIVLYLVGGSHILLAVGVILVCGGVVILGYVEDPASFRQPVKRFRLRHRD